MRDEFIAIVRRAVLAISRQKIRNKFTKYETYMKYKKKYFPTPDLTRGNICYTAHL